MKEYKVKMTDAALQDMQDLYYYIAFTLQSPQSADAQYVRIAKRILALRIFPERNPVMCTEPWHSRAVRRSNINNFSIFYKIFGRCVIVTDVLYSATNIEERLRKG